MPAWSADDLDRIGATGELEIATIRRDGTARSWVTIWVVRVGDDLLIRAYHGRDGSWFRQATATGSGRVRAGGRVFDVVFEDVEDAQRAAVDAAYRSKYGRNGYVDAMVTDAAAAATMRLMPTE